LITTSVAGVSD